MASLNDEINKQRGLVADNEREINDLRNQLKDSREENAMLNEKLAEAEKNKGEKLHNETVITYRIGKTDVSKEQLVTIYNVAQMLKDNPELCEEIEALIMQAISDKNENL